ncbi:MAG: tRNA dihydrouridine synthase DusB [Candidatus Dormibacteria bacterium]
MALAATAFRPLEIGSLELSSPVLVAPMVGITDAPCRELCREFGAGLVSTEMVAAEAVVRSTEAALHLLDFPGGVSPVAAQLVGSDPAVMADAAQVCVERGAMLVDINLGCPVPKVVSRGSGAALARDVRATARVVAAMVEAVRVPVTVKMRIGWDASTINAPELACALEDVGAAAVTVHGRTRCQKYEGAADWAQIALVKESVGVPVFGSGDVEDVETLARRIESGMVDGVVVARGMLGNFWFVRQAVHRLATGTVLPDLEFPERVALARRHLDMLCAYHGEPRALRIGRKYVAWTIRGCAGAARLRAEVQTMDTRERLDALLDRALAAGPRPEGWFRPLFVSGEG